MRKYGISYKSVVAKVKRKEKRKSSRKVPSPQRLHHPSVLIKPQRTEPPRTSLTNKKKKKNRHLCFLPKQLPAPTTKPLPMHSLNVLSGSPQQQQLKSPPSKKRKREGKCDDKDRSWRVGWVLAFCVFVWGIVEHCRQYS